MKFGINPSLVSFPSQVSSLRVVMVSVPKIVTKDEYLLMLETGGMQCSYPCLALVDWNAQVFFFFCQGEGGGRCDHI